MAYQSIFYARLCLTRNDEPAVSELERADRGNLLTRLEAFADDDSIVLRLGTQHVGKRYPPFPRTIFRLSAFLNRFDDVDTRTQRIAAHRSCRHHDDRTRCR